MSIFICSKCGAQFPKWLGQCSQCDAWGTISEQVSIDARIGHGKTKIRSNSAIDFNQINQEQSSRVKIKSEEVNRVLGGGIVPCSLILLGGQPGIGKSTLVLQMADGLKNQSVFYVSGEESAQQLKIRFDRLKISANNWKFLGETNIEVIEAHLQEYKPNLVIIDSIQTMLFNEIGSEAGSVNQVRACTARLRELAKKIKATILIIGHVTKEGTMAGPKTLEHLVDVVLYLEGDTTHHFRFLRAIKNRFGSTSEVGVFDMQPQGLIEVKNPSEVFLTNRDLTISGSVVVPVVEGSRCFLVEVQALVSRTSFGYPQRKSTGYDLSRLGLLIAVLIKRCHLSLSNQDIHINIVGGLQVREPAVDLGVALAIASAFKNKPIDGQIAVFGEVGLGGEIRGVKVKEKRIKEVNKIGFQKIVCPIDKDFISKIKITQVKNLSEAIKLTTG
ncbi:DNA repair protein RadA [Patescibacteria group bacterium]|nr:DNA repair protein RadA [Patescibacteria group bacterium]